MTTFRWGERVQDTMTGFTGVVAGYAEYPTGSREWLVQPLTDQNGAWVEGKWFHEGRLGSTGEVRIGFAGSPRGKPAAGGEK